MRRIIVLSFLSLDGVIQSPGSQEEDTSDGFTNGGWVEPYSDEVSGTIIRKQMTMDFDLLLGRKTFDIWAPYWPQHADAWPEVMTATKYVVSNTLTAHDWEPTIVLSGDIVENIKQLKQQEGPDLHVYGSSILVQALSKHDLIDALWLKIFPVILGRGKRLFAAGAIPTAFTMTESTISPRGVILANYERTGRVITGDITRS